MTVPQPGTSDTTAHNLTSTATHQFAVWYDLANELHIGRIQRGVERWGVNHVEYTFAGAPRTALAMPATDDDHNYPTVAVDGNGLLHVWANMHTTGLRAVVSTTAHDSGDWLATAGWASATSDFPSVGAACTYPTPIHFADGTLFFYLRDGAVGTGSGQSDSHSWTRTPAGSSWSSPTTLFQGLSVPDGGGIGVPGDGSGSDTAANWAAYPRFAVEPARGPHPDRLHAFWLWRAFGTSPEMDTNLAYGYSDDKGTTWKAINGTAATLPFTPFNNLACRIPKHAWIRSLSRTSSIVAATLDHANHGFIVGEQVAVEATDATFTGTFTIGAVSGTQVFWGQSGADDPDGGVGAITPDVYVGSGAGLTVDNAGLPHILVDNGPVRWIRHDGTQWVQTAIAQPLGGVTGQGRAQPAWLRNALWMVRDSGTSALRQWRPRVWRISTDPISVVMGGEVDSFGKWESSYDPEALRRFGTVEVLVPDGNRPRVYTFGRGARAVAHAA